MPAVPSLVAKALPAASTAACELAIEPESSTSHTKSTVAVLPERKTSQVGATVSPNCANAEPPPTSSSANSELVARSVGAGGHLGDRQARHPGGRVVEDEATLGGAVVEVTHLGEGGHQRHLDVGKAGALQGDRLQVHRRAGGGHHRGDVG